LGIQRAKASEKKKKPRGGQRAAPIGMEGQPRTTSNPEEKKPKKKHEAPEGDLKKRDASL